MLGFKSFSSQLLTNNFYNQISQNTAQIFHITYIALQIKRLKYCLYLSHGDVMLSRIYSTVGKCVRGLCGARLSSVRLGKKAFDREKLGTFYK